MLDPFEPVPETVLGDSTPYTLECWDPVQGAWRVYGGIWATNDEDAIKLAQERRVFLRGNLERRTWRVSRVLASTGPELEYTPERQTT